MADADLGHDIERPAPGKSDVQLGERLEAAADARRRPADPLGDRLELATRRGDEREDPIRLPEIEARQHDGVRGVATVDGHLETGRYHRYTGHSSAGRSAAYSGQAPVRTRPSHRRCLLCLVAANQQATNAEHVSVYTARDDDGLAGSRPRGAHRRH